MRRGASGFTLIEVVVAFVLLALVLSTSFQIFSSGLTRTGDLEGYSRALAVAQSQLALHAEGEAFEDSQLTGESEDRRHRWTVTISRYDQPEQGGEAVIAPYTLYRIAVHVTWQSASGSERAIDLATLAVGRRV